MKAMFCDIYNFQITGDVSCNLNASSCNSPTLRAQMGDNQPAVVYPINLMVATRCEKDDMRTCFGVAGDPQFTLSSAHEHAVCYSVDSHPMDSRFRIDGDVSGTVTTKLAKGSADGPLVIVENE